MSYIAKLNLRVPVGISSPLPSIASSLGPKGVNIMMFIKAFNQLEAIKNFSSGQVLRVLLKVRDDKTFTVKIKGRPLTDVIKSALKIQKGSSVPGKDIITSVNSEQLMQIAKDSMPYMNTRNLDKAAKTVEGKLKSMGITVNYGEKNV